MGFFFCLLMMFCVGINGDYTVRKHKKLQVFKRFLTGSASVPALLMTIRY